MNLIFSIDNFSVGDYRIHSCGYIYIHILIAAKNHIDKE